MLQLVICICVVNCLQKYRMADDDLDIEAMLEAPYVNGVSCSCFYLWGVFRTVLFFASSDQILGGLWWLGV